MDIVLDCSWMSVYLVFCALFIVMMTSFYSTIALVG